MKPASLRLFFLLLVIVAGVFGVSRLDFDVDPLSLLPQDLTQPGLPSSAFALFGGYSNTDVLNDYSVLSVPPCAPLATGAAQHRAAGRDRQHITADRFEHQLPPCASAARDTST